MEPSMFLELLQQSGTAIRPALSTFSKLGKRPTTQDDFGVLVAALLQHDPQCDIIFKLWEHDRTRNQSEDAPIILDSLSAILRYIKRRHTEDEGMTLVHRILNKHQKTLNYNINIQRVSVNKAALNLLIAMVRLGETAARAMYRSLDISQAGLAALAKKRSAFDRWSVRALFVSYVTSFFHVENPDIVAWILQQKPVVQGLFKEAEKDPKHTVMTLLAGLHLVASREDIKRKHKLALFTPHHLMILGNLYHFSDPVAARIKKEIKAQQRKQRKQEQKQQQQDEQHNQDDDDEGARGDGNSNGHQDGQQQQQQQRQFTPHFKEDDRNVPEAVHELLLLLCTNQAAGLCFVPPATHAGAVDWRQPWVSDTCANSTIQHLLATLRTPSTLGMAFELFVAACYAAPDVVPLVLTPTLVPCDDTLSLTNLANMRLTFSVLRHPSPPIRHQMYACVDYRAAMIVPPNMARSPLTRALRSQSAVVVHTAAVTLVACLARLADDIEVVAQRDLQASEQAEFQQALRAAVRKRLPDAQVLVSLYTTGHTTRLSARQLKQQQQQQRKRDKKNKKGKKGKNNGSAAATAAGAGAGDTAAIDTNAEPTRFADSTLGLFLHALAYYQRFFPDALSRFDLGRLLPRPRVAVQMSPLTLKRLFGVLREGAAVTDWLKPGAAAAAAAAAGDGDDGDGGDGSGKGGSDGSEQPAKRAKKEQQQQQEEKEEGEGASNHGADSKVETRLHHILHIHARAPPSYARFTASLLQGIFSETGAFSGPLLAELSAWWGDVPAHTAVIDLLVDTYTAVLTNPMRIAEDLLHTATAAAATADGDDDGGDDGTTTTMRTGKDEPVVDVSAVLFMLLKHAAAFCTQHGANDAAVVVAAYVADVVVRVMGAHASPLLAYIVRHHFFEPLRSNPALEPVLALLQRAITAINSAAAKDTAAATAAVVDGHVDGEQHMLPLPSIDSDAVVPVVPHAKAAAAAQLRTLPTNALIEHIVQRLVRTAASGNTALGGDAASDADAAVAMAAAATDTKSGHLYARGAAATRIGCNLVLAGTPTPALSHTGAAVNAQLAPRSANHMQVLLACLLPAPTAMAHSDVFTVSPLPQFTCTLDLLWALRGLTMAVQRCSAGAGSNGTAPAVSPAIMWLRSRVEDINAQVQLFVASHLSNRGASVGAAHALRLLYPLCLSASTPDMLRYGLACIVGNLTRLVRAAADMSPTCASVLQKTLLSAAVSRQWTADNSAAPAPAPATTTTTTTKHTSASSSSHRPLLTAMALDADTTITVGVRDLHTVLVLHVAAESEHVQQLVHSWLLWLDADGKNKAPSLSDVLFLRAVLHSTKARGLQVLSQAALNLLYSLCETADATTALAIDALLEFADIAEPDVFVAAVSRLSASLLRAYIADASEPRIIVLRQAIDTTPDNSTEIVAAARALPSVLDAPLSRCLVAESILREMNLAAVTDVNVLSTRVFDREHDDGLWWWLDAVREARATPIPDASAPVAAAIGAKVAALIHDDASELTWAEVVVALSVAGTRNGAGPHDLPPKPPSSVPPQQRVFSLLLRHFIAGADGGDNSASTVALLSTLGRLLGCATEGIRSIDLSLELVSQSFPCPLATALATQSIALLLDAPPSDTALRTVINKRKAAASFLEAVNAFLQTVFGDVLYDFEPDLARACRLVLALGNDVEVASGCNIILDPPRTAALFLRSSSFRRVLTALLGAQESTLTSMSPQRLARAKIECLLFVREVIERQPQLMAGDIGHLVLDAYTGSLSTADTICLKLLLFAESEGLKLSRMLLITGPGTSSVRRTYLGKLSTVTKDPMAVEGLARLDATRLSYTAKHMHVLPDVARSDGSSEPPTPPSAISGSAVDVSTVYDPMYMLPLLRSIVTYGGEESLIEFVEKQCARFCFAALSSPSRRIRLLGSATLAAFAAAVAKTRRKELRQLQTTVALFRDSITEPGQLLPGIIGAFAAECCQLSLHATDLPMFTITMKFVASRPTLDLKDLPLFLSLFNSSSLTHRKERIWMLRLLAQGCRNPLDLALLNRRHAVDLAMSFYLSPMSDHVARLAVLDFLAAVAQVDTGASMLNRYGIVAWIQLAVGLVQAADYASYYTRLLRLFAPISRVAREDCLEPAFCHLLSGIVQAASHDSRLESNGASEYHATLVSNVQQAAACFSKPLSQHTRHVLDQVNSTLTAA